MDAKLNRRSFTAVAMGGAALATAAAPAVAQRGLGYGMGPRGLTSGDWMQQVKAQHLAIDRQFQVLKGLRGPARRAAELMTLKTLLTAHSIAEEVALYPGVAMNVSRGESDRLYKEQQDAKVALAEIDALLAMPGRDPEFLPRLTALEGAIKAHVAEEEGTAYPRLLRAAGPAMNAKMTRDFAMSFTRYFNG